VSFPAGDHLECDLPLLGAVVDVARVLALDGEVRVLGRLLRVGNGDAFLLLRLGLLLLGGRAGQPGGGEAGGEDAGEERAEHA
jgi:hypothetical protein